MINKFKKFLTSGDPRSILAKKNILFIFFIKAFGMFIVFTMVSISITYLGKENYGIWIVLSGLIAWSNIFDLGFSNGLRNRLAEAKANNDLETGKYYVSTTYAFLIFVAMILISVFFPLIIYVDWVKLLNIASLDNETIRYTAFIIFLFFIFQFLLKPVNAILEAFQWPSISQFISVIGSFLALVGVLILLFTTKASHSLTDYAYVVAGAPVLILVVANIYLFRKKYKDISPSIKHVKRKYFNKIAGLGLYFFIIQFSAFAIFEADNIIIIYLFGPEEVTNYNIAYRYFSIISIVFGVLMAPFWSAFTDAYAKKDFTWIKRTMRTLFFLLGVSILGALFLFFISDDVYRLWINENIKIPSLLSALMAFYVVVLSFHYIVAFFSNGIGKVRIQLLASVTAVLFNIPLSYFFGKSLEMESSGVLLATIICILFIDLFLFLQYKKITTFKAEGIWNK